MDNKKIKLLNRPIRETGGVRLAAFIDLNSMRLSPEILADVLKKLPDYELVYCKFYNFDVKHDKDFLPFAKLSGAETAPPIASRKKVRADMRLVIDAVHFAVTGDADNFLIISGENEIAPLLSFLKARGKSVIMAIEASSKINALASKRIYIERAPSASFIENGEIVTARLIEAIYKSKLPNAEKLVQTQTLEKIKAAILQLAR